MRRTRLFAVALAALAGAACTLVLDYDKEGLPCDAANECLDGYVCDAKNLCVPKDVGDCRPACGAFQTCFKSECVPTCDKRPCGAAQYCKDGSCLQLPGDHGLGGACKSDDECPAAGFCLLPYGGDTGGVCTKTCTDANGCSGNAKGCRAFPGVSGQVKLCVGDTFLSCTKESDCSTANLSCGAYALTAAKDAILACRTRVPGGHPIGEVCSQFLTCATGLCVKTNGNGDQRCVTPCTSTADCLETMKDDDADCLPVTLNASGANGLPRVRPSLCVPGGASQLLSCEASAGPCHADAPDCVTLPGGTGKNCATVCGDGTKKCPDGLHCDATTTPSYCVPN
jgi:hypothetical protein